MSFRNSPVKKARVELSQTDLEEHLDEQLHFMQNIQEYLRTIPDPETKGRTLIR